MPKLPTLTHREMLKILEKKGFILDRVKGSHHIYYHPNSKRRVTVPVHRKDFPKGTLQSILKQAGIDRDDIS